MNNFFAGRLGFDSLGSSLFQSTSSSAYGQASFASTSNFSSSFAPNTSAHLVPVDSVFRDGAVQHSSSLRPFDPRPQLFLPIAFLQKEPSEHRAVDHPSIQFPLDVARQKIFARTVSTNSVLDLSGLLPGDGYSSHPSFVCATSEPSSSPGYSSVPALKKLFTIRSLLRLLPLHSFDLVHNNSPPSIIDDLDFSFFSRKRKIDDICRGDFMGDCKRSCGTSSISLKVDPLETLTLTDRAFSQFIEDASSKFAERFPYDDPSVCLVESFQSITGEGDLYHCEDLDLELDHLCSESAVEPDSFAQDLKSAITHAETQTSVDDEISSQSARNLDVIRSKMAVQALVDILACLETLHTSLFAERAPNKTRLRLYRLLMTLLYAMVCRSPVLAVIIDGQNNRRYRNNVISVFFKATLRPILSSECADIIVLSKAGLAHLDSKQKKIPRDVVESVLRPALIQFLDLSQVDIRLVVGLHSIVELFPSLFKEVFARRILETLKLFVHPTDAPTFKHSPQEVAEMIVYLLDFFRLFATSKTFTCAHWLDNLAQLVMDLETSWNIEKQSSANSCCCGFRSPLCRLMCQYPAESAALMLEKQHEPVGSVLLAVSKCRHAQSLRSHFQTKLTAFSSRFSLTPVVSRSSPFADVTLVPLMTGPSVSAHRVVLANRSEYFRGLLSSSGEQSVVILKDINFEALDILLDFVYSQSIESLSKRSKEELMELVVLGEQIRMTDVMTACELILSARVTAESFSGLLSFAMGLVSDKDSVDPKLCGPCGSSLLRACQSFLLANLGTLCDQIDLEDPTIVCLLASDQRTLCRSHEAIVC